MAPYSCRPRGSSVNFHWELLSLSLCLISLIFLSHAHFNPINPGGPLIPILLLPALILLHSLVLEARGFHTPTRHMHFFWGCFLSLKGANRQYGNNIHKNFCNIFHNNSTPTYTHLNISLILVFYLLLTIWHVNFERSKLSLKTKAPWKV